MKLEKACGCHISSRLLRCLQYLIIFQPSQVTSAEDREHQCTHNLPLRNQSPTECSRMLINLFALASVLAAAVSVPLKDATSLSSSNGLTNHDSSFETTSQHSTSRLNNSQPAVALGEVISYRHGRCSFHVTVSEVCWTESLLLRTLFKMPYVHENGPGTIWTPGRPTRCDEGQTTIVPASQGLGQDLKITWRESKQGKRIEYEYNGCKWFSDGGMEPRKCGKCRLGDWTRGPFGSCSFQRYHATRVSSSECRLVIRRRTSICRHLTWTATSTVDDGNNT